MQHALSGAAGSEHHRSRDSVDDHRYIILSDFLKIHPLEIPAAARNSFRRNILGEFSPQMNASDMRDASRF
jgi:hypothetical protein